jgi:hypothetical protein
MICERWAVLQLPLAALVIPPPQCPYASNSGQIDAFVK